MLDKTTLAKAVSALADKGLVVRTADPDNRRKNVLRLTDAGRDTIRESADIYDRWLNTVCACLTEAEQRQLSVLLNRLVENALALRPFPAGCK
jgi:DNA-binding MarR family transcriptional regulator